MDCISPCNSTVEELYTLHIYTFMFPKSHDVKGRVIISWCAHWMWPQYYQSREYFPSTVVGGIMISLRITTTTELSLMLRNYHSRPLFRYQVTCWSHGLYDGNVSHGVHINIGITKCLRSPLKLLSAATQKFRIVELLFAARKSII